jgi:hypothetical protein
MKGRFAEGLKSKGTKERRAGLFIFVTENWGSEENQSKSILVWATLATN